MISRSGLLCWLARLHSDKLTIVRKMKEDIILAYSLKPQSSKHQHTKGKGEAYSDLENSGRKKSASTCYEGSEDRIRIQYTNKAL